MRKDGIRICDVCGCNDIQGNHGFRFVRLTMLARQKSVNLFLGVRALAILLCFCASLCAEHAHILWTRGGSIPSNVSVAYSPDGRLTADRKSTRLNSSHT